MYYILLAKTYRISWRKKEAITLLKGIINRSELMDIHAILNRTITHTHISFHRASQVVLVVKNLPDNEGDIRYKGSPDNEGDIRYKGSIPGSFPGGGHGNALQYSCLENPIDREGLEATVHRITKSWTQLK